MLVKHAEAITIANGGIASWGWVNCGSPDVSTGGTLAVPFNIGESSFLAQWDLSTATYSFGTWQHSGTVYTGYTVATLGAVFDGTSGSAVCISPQNRVGVSPTLPQQLCAARSDALI